MPLSLIVGPANAGKVDLLLDRYLAALEREPFLIVPGGADVERVERELLARTGALLAGGIGTFDDLFESIAAGDPERRRVLTDAQRADVAGALPYEPGRVAFASRRRIAEDLGELAGPRIDELAPRFGEVAHPTLAYLERSLFEEAAVEPPELEGAIRFFEGAGARGALELVAEELLELIRAGTAPEAIALVCDSIDRWRAPLETVLGTIGVPYAIEERPRLAKTAFGHALLSLLRFAWLGGARKELFAFLRSPYSGLSRGSVDFVEGRLRGRAVHTAARVEEEAERLRGAPVPALGELRAAESAVAGARTLVESMVRSAYGLEA